MPLSRFLSCTVISIASNEHPVWRGHSKEAKRGQPCGHRITRNDEAMVSLLLTCATTWLSLIAGWCLMGATPRGQPGTPALTLPHVRDGLSVRLLEVFGTFRMLSSCRHVHRQLMRNELPDCTTIIPATACHQRNYVETYSRSMEIVRMRFSLGLLQPVRQDRPGGIRQSAVDSMTGQYWVVSLDSVYEYERAISENAHGTLLMYNTRPASGESHGVHHQLLSEPPMHALW